VPTNAAERHPFCVSNIVQNPINPSKIRVSDVHAAYLFIALVVVIAYGFWNTLEQRCKCSSVGILRTRSLSDKSQFLYRNVSTL